MPELEVCSILLGVARDRGTQGLATMVSSIHFR
jgi:hypothetical protein